jgi:hypothetical protein
MLALQCAAQRRAVASSSALQPALSSMSRRARHAPSVAPKCVDDGVLTRFQRLRAKILEIFFELELRMRSTRIVTALLAMTSAKSLMQ